MAKHRARSGAENGGGGIISGRRRRNKRIMAYQWRR